MKQMSLSGLVCRSIGLAVLIFLAGCRDESTVTPPEYTVQVTLGGYNVENWFDLFDDPYLSDESTRPTPLHTIAAQARMIRNLEVDFLGLVEIENEGLLIEFNRYVLNDRSDGMAWTYTDDRSSYPVAGGETSSPLASQPDVIYPDKDGYFGYTFVNRREGGRGINNGFLSQIPVESVTQYRFDLLSLPGESRTWAYARHIVHARLKPAHDVTLHVFVVHFKSKRDSRDDPNSNRWRLAEAAGLRARFSEILARDPGAYIALVGDVNDTPGSAVHRMLTEPGNDGVAMIDVHADLPESQRITYLREPYRSQIDYVLVSPAMAKHLVPDSARVVYVGDGASPSDHAPILASFALPTSDPAANERLRSRE